jgi:hypothetical protein
MKGRVVRVTPSQSASDHFLKSQFYKVESFLIEGSPSPLQDYKDSEKKHVLVSEKRFN